MNARDARVLVFVAGGRRWALPLARVAEVMRPLPVERVPGAPTFVAGAARYRGKLAVVVSVAALLDTDEQAQRWLALRTASPLLLAVDAIVGAAALDAAGRQDLAPLLSACADRFVQELALRDQQTLAILDEARLVAATAEAVAALESS